jgi:hypothetical protein
MNILTLHIKHITKHNYNIINKLIITDEFTTNFELFYDIKSSIYKNNIKYDEINKDKILKKLLIDNSILNIVIELDSFTINNYVATPKWKILEIHENHILNTSLLSLINTNNNNNNNNNNDSNNDNSKHNNNIKHANNINHTNHNNNNTNINKIDNNIAQPIIKNKLNLPFNQDVLKNALNNLKKSNINKEQSNSETNNLDILIKNLKPVNINNIHEKKEEQPENNTLFNIKLNKVETKEHKPFVEILKEEYLKEKNNENIKNNTSNNVNEDNTKDKIIIKDIIKDKIVIKDNIKDKNKKDKDKKDKDKKDKKDKNKKL